MAILPPNPQKVALPVDDGSPAPYGTTHPVTHQVAEAIVNALTTSGLTLTLGGQPVPMEQLGHARQSLPLLLWSIARPQLGPLLPDGLRLAFVPYQSVAPEGEHRSYVAVRVLNPQVSEAQLTRWTQALLEMLRTDESLQPEAAKAPHAPSLKPGWVRLDEGRTTFVNEVILPALTRHDAHQALAEELLGLALGASTNEPALASPTQEEKGRQLVEDMRKTAEYPQRDVSKLDDRSPDDIVGIIQELIESLNDQATEATGRAHLTVDEPSGRTPGLPGPFPLLTAPDARLAALLDNQHRTCALTDALGEVYVPITVDPNTYADATVMTPVIDGWSLRLKTLMKRPPYDTFLMADRLFARMSMGMGMDDEGARLLGGQALKAVLVQMDGHGVLAPMPVRWRVALVQGLMHPAARDEEVIEALRRDLDLDARKDEALLRAGEVPGTTLTLTPLATTVVPSTGWILPPEVTGKDREDLMMVFPVVDSVEIYGATQETFTRVLPPIVEATKNWDDSRWARLLDALTQGLIVRCPELMGRPNDHRPDGDLDIDIKKILIKVIRDLDRDLPESRRNATIKGLVHQIVHQDLHDPFPLDWKTLPHPSLADRQASKNVVAAFLDLCNAPPVTENHTRVLDASVQNPQSLDLLRRLILNHWPHAQRVSPNRLLVQLVRNVASPLNEVLLGMGDGQDRNRLPVPAWFRNPAWTTTGKPLSAPMPSSATIASMVDENTPTSIEKPDNEDDDEVSPVALPALGLPSEGTEPGIEVEQQRFKPCRGSVGEFPNSAMFKVLVDNTPLRTVGMDPWDWQDAMDRTFPWMGEVTARVTRRLSIQLAHNLPLQLPTLGLLGGSGVGKTLYWTEAMRLLDHPFIVQGMGGQNDSVAIKGTNAGWANARPGLAATVMASLTCGNPVIMLDEIDKTAGNDRNGQPMDALLPLLETATARVYRDDCLQLTVDTSHISWLMTLNDEDGLSPELRSRVELVEVNGPDWSNPAHVDAAIRMGEMLAWKAWPTRMATDDTRLSAAQKDRLRNTRWKSLRSLSQGLRALIEDNLYQASLEPSLGRRANRPAGWRPA